MPISGDPFWYEKQLASARGQLAAGRWDSPPALPTMGVGDAFMGGRARTPHALDLRPIEGPTQQIGPGGTSPSTVNGAPDLAVAVAGALDAVTGAIRTGVGAGSQDAVNRAVAAEARRREQQVTTIVVAGALLVGALWLRHKGHI